MGVQTHRREDTLSVFDQVDSEHFGLVGEVAGGFSGRGKMMKVQNIDIRDQTKVKVMHYFRLRERKNDQIQPLPVPKTRLKKIYLSLLSPYLLLAGIL